MRVQKTNNLFSIDTDFFALHDTLIIELNTKIL